MTQMCISYSQGDYSCDVMLIRITMEYDMTEKAEGLFIFLFGYAEGDGRAWWWLRPQGSFTVDQRLMDFYI